MILYTKKKLLLYIFNNVNCFKIANIVESKDNFFCRLIIKNPRKNHLFLNFF